jgi:tetratricopeptide (TPR) repeat protein
VLLSEKDLAMKRNLIAIINVLFLLSLNNLQAQQDTAAPKNSPATQKQTPTKPAGFNLSDYGVTIQPEPRLIIMMVALEAAGLDSVSEDTFPVGAFRAQVRKDLANLDPDLRGKLKAFYDGHKVKSENKTSLAATVARYVSLAYALGPAPDFKEPERTDDLPQDLLDVLDFASLLRQFYQKSGIQQHLPSYLREHQSQGEALRKPATEMVRMVLTYLNTRPITSSIERISIKSSSDKKKQTKQQIVEHQRRFILVPDLLAIPGVINFRVIGDDYYVIVPTKSNSEGKGEQASLDLASSEARRGYLQYVIDPLVIGSHKEVSKRREEIKQLLDTHREWAKSLTEEKRGTIPTMTADPIIAVSRSIVAAADIRMDENLRLQTIKYLLDVHLKAAKTEADRTAISKQAQTIRSAILDETFAQLSEAYERGNVLVFYFADQLRGLETSGFDISNFLTDMLSSFDVNREKKRLVEHAEPIKRALAYRQEYKDNERKRLEALEARHTRLVNSLNEVKKLLDEKKYVVAEETLNKLLQDYKDEPRVLFALGQTVRLSAQDATDEASQSERLNRALAYYKQAVKLASAEEDRSIISKSYESMGRILAFLEQKEEAIKAYNEAIKIGDVEGGAYKEAATGKQKLEQRP